MAESKTKDENFYVIHGWMLNRYHLKGTALMVFAIIYGFTQDGETEFSGSLQYLCDFTGLGRTAIIQALSKLTDDGLLEKVQTRINGVTFNKYTSSVRGVRNPNGGSTESERGGSTESEPNNIVSNNIKDIYSKGAPRFTPPTVDEVRDYCRERRNGIDAEKFVDYYTANGWMCGKTHMKDWKAAVRNWERSKFNEKPEEEKSMFEKYHFVN